MSFFSFMPEISAHRVAIVPITVPPKLSAMVRLELAHAKEIKGLLKTAGGLFEMAMCTWWGIPHHWQMLVTGPLSLLGFWLMFCGVLDWFEGRKDRRQIRADACALAASCARLRKAAGIEQPSQGEIERLREAGFFN